MVEGHLNLTEGSNSPCLTLQKLACISVPTSRGPAFDLMAFSRARKAFYPWESSHIRQEIDYWAFCSDLTANTQRRLAKSVDTFPEFPFSMKTNSLKVEFYNKHQILAIPRRSLMNYVWLVLSIYPPIHQVDIYITQFSQPSLKGKSGILLPQYWACFIQLFGICKTS